MSEPLSQRLSSKWPLWAVLIGLPAVALILYGCETTAPPQIITTNTGRQIKDSCETRLASALDKARPEALGIVGIDAALRATPEDAAAAFTTWLTRSDCREAVATEPLSAEGRELVGRLLGPTGAERVTAERFGPFDAAHVRNALIDFAAAQSLAKEANDDLARLLRLFEYVTRTVALQGESTVNVPLTSHEALLFGRGSAEDRALLFTGLLRQLRIDAVVLRPSGEGEGGPWWVGVLQKDGVYLFDMELGLPVPAPDAPPPAAPNFLPKPATWAQVVANADLLVAYRRDAGLTAEAIPADRLKAPRVELIGPASFWKTAMERLELSLPGERGVLLYDPLQDTQTGPGLYRRVADAGLSEAITVWPYPDTIEAARADLTAPQRERLEQRIYPYFGLVLPNEKSGLIEREKELWRTRVAHMTGRPQPTVVSYQSIWKFGRNPGVELPPADVDLNRRAADEAGFWIAQAQFDQGQYASAGAAARRYVEQGGSRADEAAALAALALAADGKTAEAAEAIAKLPETAPGLARLRWLAARWKSGK